MRCAGMAVAVGVDGLRHFGVGGFAVQQLIRLSQNGLLLHADELRRARGDGFGPFGLAAHDKHRLTERRGLLLQAAGVGQDEEAAGHQVVHLLDVDRVDEVDARMAAQDRERTFAHVPG